MRFGTFHLIGSPDMAPAERRFADTLEQIQLVDELGFDTVWVAEHHFSNYGYSVNPLLLIARAFPHTRRVRFGQSVLVTPFWHPVRLAEDIALTDILTDGRLDIGLGRGYQPMEFRGLDVPMDDTRALFQEHLEVMLKAWTQDDFTHEGRYYQVPTPITVLPRPLQKPHPPLWLAAQSDPSIDLAAAAGYHVMLSGTLRSRELATAWRQRHVAGWAEAGCAGQPRFAVQRFVYVTESEAEARAAVWQTRWQRRVADHLGMDNQQLVAGRNEPYPTQDELSDEEWWDRLVYGTPDRCITQLRRDAEMGITDMMCWFDVGGLDNAAVLRSIRLFANEVLPAFADSTIR